MSTSVPASPAGSALMRTGPGEDSVARRRTAPHRCGGGWRGEASRGGYRQSRAPIDPCGGISIDHRT
jgi:hypothetical protein